MFGFGKSKRTKKLWEAIGTQLSNTLAFQRSMNGGRLPDSVKKDHYVLGYHWMLCMHFYREAVNGNTNPEECGLVLNNALGIALDTNWRDIGAVLEPLMAEPDEPFETGIAHANSAYEKLVQGDSSALEEFSLNISGKY